MTTTTILPPPPAATDAVGDQLAAWTTARDRAMACLADLIGSCRGGLIDGMDIQLWLQQVCRLLPAQARQLVGVADTLRRLPVVRALLDDGRLSWDQAETICRAGRRLRVGQLADLDAAVGAAADEYTTALPDELTNRVWGWIDQWAPSRLRQAEQAAQHGESLYLLPDLFGGGTLTGEFGPESFSTITEALDTPLGPPSTTDITDLADDTAGPPDRHPDQALAQAQGRRRAAALVGLCHDRLAGTTRDGRRIPPRPTALIVTTQGALLDTDRTPGWLLHTLSGGAMKVSSQFATDLLDRRGADLRTIVLDDCGQIVGVGRRTHIPPDWLREAILARDLTDTAPGSHTPVRRCDLDHILPWDHAGRTDVDNLQPIGRTAHRAKTRRRWHTHRLPDGTTTWTHRPSGLTITRPPTWKHRHPPAPD